MPGARIVIVVEDSSDCAETLEIALETLQGIEVHIVMSGEAALELIARSSNAVAAIVTDLQMPRMSGMDLLSRIKAEPALCHIPVLIISGDSDPRLPTQSLSSGAHAFFSKPYSPIAVRHTLEQILQ